MSDCICLPAGQDEPGIYASYVPVPNESCKAHYRKVILQGDVRERLADLPDESVHCVVTSPPYWGLRDYGTASWEGGDPSHAHRGRDERSSAPGSAKQASSVGANYLYAGDCAC